MGTYSHAANGLKKVFMAEIISIIAALLSAIPGLGIIGIIGGILCLILSVIGLNEASMDDTGFRTALILNVVNIVISLFTSGDGTFNAIMSIASSVLSLASLYYVCHSASGLLRNIGQNSIAANGDTVWNINLICTIAAVICGILSIIPLINILAALASIIIVIVEIVAAIMYMIFLNNCSKAL